MDLFSLLFSAASGLTGGLVTDMKTLMLSVITILFICMGANKLKDIMLDRKAANEEAANYEMADYYHREMREYERGTVAYDIARSRYRHYLKKLTH